MGARPYPITAAARPLAHGRTAAPYAATLVVLAALPTVLLLRSQVRSTAHPGARDTAPVPAEEALP